MFRGKRVPVSTLFENLRDGATIEQFLEWFPGVEGWKAEAVLERSVCTAGTGRTCRHRAFERTHAVAPLRYPVKGRYDSGPKP